MSEKFKYDLIQGVKGNTHVTADFIKGVEAMAERLKTKPEFILAAMSFETGSSFNPAIQNGIGATGLIQFLKSTAKGLGTTTDALRKMSAVEQLAFVEKYFKGFAGKLGTLEAVYTTILSGSPKKPDDVLFKAGTIEYKMNPLDWNQDGEITAREATTIVGARLFGGVKAVQQKLLELGIVPDAKKVGFDDAKWGKTTTEVLAKFQKSKGLEATGLMDEATGRALFSIGETAEPEKETSLKTDLEKGSEGEAVKRLQEGLVGLGYMSMEKIGNGFGKFGPQTSGAVEAFQKDSGLAVNGKFGDVEQKILDSIQSGIVKGSPQTQIVKAIQDQLVKIGVMTQAQVDTGYGTFGNQTLGAVKKFQAAKLLPESGVVEAVTFKLLFSSESTQKTPENKTISAKTGAHYTALDDVLITETVQKKIEKVADLYFQKTGKNIIVTSGYRPPERQSPAMYNKIVNEGEASVRRLYRNKGAVDQILNAYRANKGNRASAIAAMTETITKQVKSGIFISSHLRSNAIDVRMTANLKALNAAVIETGGRIVVERDHFHLELH
ncbi:hypothetical protein BH10ACI1_BH10ACI1_16840 [soil metagenome]